MKLTRNIYPNHLLPPPKLLEMYTSHSMEPTKKPTKYLRCKFVSAHKNVRCKNVWR